MQVSRQNWTLWITLAITVLATGAQAYQHPFVPQTGGAAQTRAHSTPLAVLPPPIQSGPQFEAAYRVAQDSSAIDLGIRPRPRPTGLTLTGLVGENNAVSIPVSADQSGTIIRPRPRADTATPIPDIAESIQIAAPSDPTPQQAEDILRPLPRPQGFAQSVRAAASTQQIQRVQQENESTPATAVVTNAASGTNQLALDQITLIGVFGTDEARRALLRLPSGDFQPVARSTVVEGWRVLTIDRTTVRIGRDGEVRILEMP